jgi:hypothetical protein
VFHATLLHWFLYITYDCTSYFFQKSFWKHTPPPPIIVKSKCAELHLLMQISGYLWLLFLKTVPVVSYFFAISIFLFILQRLIGTLVQNKNPKRKISIIGISQRSADLSVNVHDMFKNKRIFAELCHVVCF